MKLFLSCLVITIFCACNQRAGKIEYNCAEELGAMEMMSIMKMDTVKYGHDDSVNITIIKSIISPYLENGSELKVSYSFRNAVTLAIDIYGVEELTKIDLISCALFNESRIVAPANLFLLFNKADPGTVKIVISPLKRKTSNSDK